MRNKCSLLTLTLLALLPGLCARAEAVDGNTLFREQVRPLLTRKCLVCHGGDKKRAGLDLTRRQTALKGGDSGPAFKPGSARDSLLFQKVHDHEMPPQNPLPVEQVKLLEQWIDAGAPYTDEPLTLVVKRAGPDWWSLRPIRRPGIPQLATGGLTPRRSLDNPLDAFIV